MKNVEFTITEDLLATKQQRFLNLIIDLLFIYIIILSAGTAIMLIGEASYNLALSDWVKSMGWVEIILYSVLIMFLYYSLTEIYFSRTFAQLVTRTVVVKSDGSKPDNITLFKRTLFRFIPFEPFSFLGASVRGWHDIFSETYVVKKKKLSKIMNLIRYSDETEKA